MRLIDEEVLIEARSRERCEWCGRRGPLDAAHILSKGAGRVDLPCNIVALDRFCHSRSHAGDDPTTADLLAIAAAREGILQDDIRRMVWAVRRAPKGSDLKDVLRELQ